MTFECFNNFTPLLCRYIYWNAHFFGENFYGWSIGDRQSLVESGPFHSQGEEREGEIVT